MANVKSLNESLKYDRRLLGMNLKNKTLTRADYDSYIGQLPDLSDQAEPMTLTDVADSMEAPPMEPESPVEVAPTPETTVGNDGGFFSSDY